MPRCLLQGRVFMTHPTKAIYAILLKDFVKVARGSVDEGLYNDADLEASMNRIELIDFHQTLDLGGTMVRTLRMRPLFYIPRPG